MRTTKSVEKKYQEWSREAQKAQIDTGLSNRVLAERLGYTRQFVTAIVNGKNYSPLAISKISKCLNIAKVETNV